MAKKIIQMSYRVHLNGVIRILMINPEQFGENFKRGSNKAVGSLLWQENYKKLLRILKIT